MTPGPFLLTIMAKTTIMAMNKVMSMRMNSSDGRAAQNRQVLAEDRVADVFKVAGWKVRRAQPPKADLLVSRGHRFYCVQVKAAAESRRDRLIPLLAAAILEAQAAARASSAAKPLAIVAAPRISERLVGELEKYAAVVAPDMALGLVDFAGRVKMRGPDLDELSTVPANPRSPKLSGSNQEPFDLFSDLNQWMLKVLLADRIPGPLLSSPRVRVLSAAELAVASHVSLPTAFRLMRHLLAAGWVDRSEPLRLVRIQKLLRRWQAANTRPAREIGMRWVIPGRSDQQLRQALQKYRVALESSISAREDSRSSLPGGLPRACLSMFSAAQALGFGHVHGVAQHLYLEAFSVSAIQALGLSVAEPGEPVDVFVRVPRFRQSVFRGAVERDGVLVSDILQVWLDVSGHPARGDEQADEIWKRALRPVVADGGEA